MATDFLEKQVEEKIVTALQAEVGSLGTVVGFLQPSAAGTTKASGLTNILVTCRPRAGVFGRGEITLSIWIDAKVEFAKDPSGDLISEFAAPVMNAVESWHASVTALRSAVNVDGVFRADAIVNAEGGDAGLDSELGIWYWSFGLTLKGWIL